MSCESEVVEKVYTNRNVHEVERVDVGVDRLRMSRKFWDGFTVT